MKLRHLLKEEEHGSPVLILRSPKITATLWSTSWGQPPVSLGSQDFIKVGFPVGDFDALWHELTEPVITTAINVPYRSQGAKALLEIEDTEHSDEAKDLIIEIVRNGLARYQEFHKPLHDAGFYLYFDQVLTDKKFHDIVEKLKAFYEVGAQ
jgi:hypothetical protein